MLSSEHLASRIADSDMGYNSGAFIPGDQSVWSTAKTHQLVYNQLRTYSLGVKHPAFNLEERGSTPLMCFKTMVDYKHDYWECMELDGKISRTKEKRWGATGPNGDVGYGMTQIEALEHMVHMLSTKVRRLRKQLVENKITPRTTH